jgi:hypothetical protein
MGHVQVGRAYFSNSNVVSASFPLALLVPHLPEINGSVWEPACGGGKMVAALRQAGFDVIGSDITDGVDFLHYAPPQTGISAIITNPPYLLAREFIEHALHLDGVRVVAMLLRTDSTTQPRGRTYSPVVRCSPRRSC